MQHKYLKISAKYSGTSFEAIVKVNGDKEFTKEEIANLICEKQQVSIVHAEISSTTTPSTKGDYNVYAGNKYDLTTAAAN